MKLDLIFCGNFIFTFQRRFKFSQNSLLKLKFSLVLSLLSKFKFSLKTSNFLKILS